MRLIKRWLDKVLATASVALFTLLVVIVVWQVFTRQVTKDPATWTEEAARLTFVWLGLFATALVFSERGHIAVDFVVRRLPESVQRAISILVQLTIIAFAALVLIWGGYRAAGRAWTQELSALPFTAGQMYLVLPLTGLIITFYAVYHVTAIIRRTEEAFAIDDAAEPV